MAMASSLRSLLSCLFFSAVVLTCHCSGHPHGGDVRSRHVLAVRTLLPSDVCSSWEGSNHTGLKLVHRHGPCSPTHGRRGPSKLPSAAQTLLLDESRANSLRRRRKRTPAAETQISTYRQLPRGSLVSTIPARLGTALGTAGYLVTVGFGTPKQDLSVVFDTGSDLTWIQCRPCAAYCYQQQEPLFDPAQSSSYHNISCSDDECSAVQSATGHAPGCASSTCLYGIQYGDSSYSIGFYARETISVTPYDVFPGFRFGCGERNRGLFGQTAGLLGLGRDPVSLVSQASGTYGRVFSYCLPPTASSTGYLKMGAGPPSSGIRFTPMLSNSNMPSFYFLDMIGINVGGRPLRIPVSVFRSAGTLVDSGTVITRLPPAAYKALRSAFRRGMAKYPAAPSLSILDTCYDLSKYDTVSVPTVAMVFQGGVTVEVDVSGILYVAGASQACLAFAGNADSSDMAIVGSTQQRTYQVVYDLARGLIGFGAGGCS